MLAKLSGGRALGSLQGSVLATLARNGSVLAPTGVGSPQQRGYSKRPDLGPAADQTSASADADASTIPPSARVAELMKRIIRTGARTPRSTAEALIATAYANLGTGGLNAYNVSHFLTTINKLASANPSIAAQTMRDRRFYMIAAEAEGIFRRARSDPVFSERMPQAGACGPSVPFS